MKVKKGQWVRYEFNGVTDFYHATHDFTTEPRAKVIKVADDPRKLIQVDDLVCVANEPSRIISDINPMKTLYWVRGFMVATNISDITKILTPNSNDGYDLQWSDTDGL